MSWGSLPTYSMMSISPLRGQPPEIPSVQKAGQTPRPLGNLARNSIRP